MPPAVRDAVPAESLRSNRTPRLRRGLLDIPQGLPLLTSHFDQATPRLALPSRSRNEAEQGFSYLKSFIHE